MAKGTIIGARVVEKAIIPEFSGGVVAGRYALPKVEKWSEEKAYKSGDLIAEYEYAEGSTEPDFVRVFKCIVANATYGQYIDSEWELVDTFSYDEYVKNYAETIGNGDSNSSRSNARTLDWDGNETLAGKLTLGAGPTKDMDAATKQYVDSKASSSNNKADKADTVLDTTLSRGRKTGTTAGDGSFAFGNDVEASGDYSFAIGTDTVAGGTNSFASGNNSRADGENAVALGGRTTASGGNQFVFGRLNEEDLEDEYIEIVGNGIAAKAAGSGIIRYYPNNARTLDWDGNEKLAGKLTVGAAPTADMDVATKKYVDDAIASAEIPGGTPVVDTNTTYTLTQDATDGHKITLTPSTGNPTTITIPDNNTTYSSKAAASGGTAVSLVTTGEKYTWNNKVNANQGAANAGKFLMVNSSGNVEAIAMSVWQGGAY